MRISNLKIETPFYCYYLKHSFLETASSRRSVLVRVETKFVNTAHAKRRKADDGQLFSE
jgi:hypothetical protein